MVGEVDGVLAFAAYGIGLVQNRGDAFLFFQGWEWDYDFFHTTHPYIVYWQDLWNDNNIRSSYLTAPSVWRSYFQMTGYLLDNANQRLWLRPRIPTSMGQQITNAPLLNIKCWGNLNFDGRITDVAGQIPKRTQRLSVTFDSLITVKQLVLNNNTDLDKPFVRVTSGNTGINDFTCSTEVSGLEKNIRITFKEPLQIGPSGLLVEVYTGEVSVGVPGDNRSLRESVLSINTTVIAKGRPIQYTVNEAGPVTIDLLALNGAKICTMLHQYIEKPGTYDFFWNNGKEEAVKLGSKIMVMRLSTRSGIISRLVSRELK